MVAGGPQAGGQPPRRALARVQIAIPEFPAPTKSTAAIDNANAALEKAKTYASLDAKAFRPAINPANQEKVIATLDKWEREHPQKRAEVAIGRQRRAVAGAGYAVQGADFQALIARQRQNVDGNRNVVNPYKWNAEDVERIYQNVTNQKGGECTSFGKFAGHILTTTAVAAGKKPRVELVGWMPEEGGTGHIYCIVNRDGQYVQSEDGKWMLPPVDDWHGEWRIVDPWAGAMGYPIVYKSKEEFHHYSGMLSPLYLQMQYHPGVEGWH